MSRGGIPNPFSCKVTKTCKWGDAHGCNWLLAHKASRVNAGYPIVDGKCGAYTKGRVNRQKPMSVV